MHTEGLYIIFEIDNQYKYAITIDALAQNQGAGRGVPQDIGEHLVSDPPPQIHQQQTQSLHQPRRPLLTPLHRLPGRPILIPALHLLRKTGQHPGLKKIHPDEPQQKIARPLNMLLVHVVERLQ